MDSDGDSVWLVVSVTVGERVCDRDWLGLIDSLGVCVSVEEMLGVPVGLGVGVAVGDGVAA